MEIVNNKLTRIDAQLIVCLAGLMGLRPFRDYRVVLGRREPESGQAATAPGLRARPSRHHQE